jgi:hypothetical protein
MKEGYHYEDDWYIEDVAAIPVKVFSDSELAATYTESRNRQESLVDGYYVVSLPLDEETYLVINKHGRVVKVYDVFQEAKGYVSRRKNPSDYTIKES